MKSLKFPRGTTARAFARRGASIGLVARGDEGLKGAELEVERLGGKALALPVVQMPALNTPQFNWVKSRLPRKPQPLPPIYQPEVAAEAIYWAAHHHRRELSVGMSTLKAVIGNKFIPGLPDHYPRWTGYEAQQYDGADDPHRPYNLWEPVPHDVGAHGDFDRRAKGHSLQLWADTHRGWMALAGIGIAGLVYRALRGNKR